MRTPAKLALFGAGTAQNTEAPIPDPLDALEDSRSRS